MHSQPGADAACRSLILATPGPVFTHAAWQVCADDPWVSHSDLAAWQEDSQKQIHPNPATAKPIGTSDSDVRLTMHQRCPWIQDPVDQEQGHSVEDPQCAALLQPVVQHSSLSNDVWSGPSQTDHASGCMQ